MRKILILASLLSLTLGLESAKAGGMGDSAAHIKELNAICDAQRRGEAPPSPDFCLPEYPPYGNPRAIGRSPRNS